MDYNHIFQRPTLQIFSIVTSRKCCLAEDEIEETMSNRGYDLSSENKLLTVLDYITIDSGDEALPGERQWLSGIFTPIVSQFIGESSLQNTVLLAGRISLDYFQLFFDETIMQRVIDETNRYYLQNPVIERQHMSNWQNVTSIEMYTFLAITMLTGLIDKNRIRDYMSTDPRLATPIFSQYFARNRYQDILRYTHFANNADISDTNGLEKIKPIIDDFRRKFKNCMNPTQNLCIDESLVL